MANLAKQLARIDLYHGEDINNFTDIDESVERHYKFNKSKFDEMATVVIGDQWIDVNDRLPVNGVAILARGEKRLRKNIDDKYSYRI